MVQSERWGVDDYPCVEHLGTQRHTLVTYFAVYHIHVLIAAFIEGREWEELTV